MSLLSSTELARRRKRLWQRFESFKKLPFEGTLLSEAFLGKPKRHSTHTISGSLKQSGHECSELGFIELKLVDMNPHDVIIKTWYKNGEPRTM